MASSIQEQKPIIYFNKIHEFHSGPKYHPECPERVKQIMVALQPQFDSGVLTLREFSVEVDGKAARGERPSYWTLKDGDTYATYLTPRILEISHTMIQSAVADLCGGATRCAFVLCRPPGHHAAEKPAGFCHQNNAWNAVGLLRAAGVNNIAIYDWDAHHGDGTEALVEADTVGGVRFCSSHAYGDGIYPGTGAEKRTERIFNVPLPRDTTGPELLTKFRDEILPFVGAPEILIISAGYDGHSDDPMQLLKFSTETYATMAAMIHRLGVPVLFLLEGGYNPVALAESVVATLAPWGGL